MSDVRTVFVTKEVAEMLDVSSSYLLRLVKTINLTESEFRSTGKRNHLFSKEAVRKLQNRK